MLRQYDRGLRRLLLALDVSLCGGIFLFLPVFAESSFLADGTTSNATSLLLLGLVASLSLPLAIRRFDTTTSTRLQTLGRLIRNLFGAAGLTLLVLAATAFALGAAIEPWILFTGVAVQLACVGLVRITVLAGLRSLRRHGRNFRNVLIIGTGPRAVAVTRTIETHKEWGLKIIGYLDEGDVPFDPAIAQERVHKFVDSPQLIRDEVIDEVITACPRSMLDEIGPVVAMCSSAGIPLTVMTDLFGEFMPPPRVRRFGGHEGLSFRPVHHSRAHLHVKRAVDLLGSGVGLVIAAPILAVAAIAIKLNSPGPIFFRQMRCGLNGRPFSMLKLRTMVADAENRKAELSHLNEMDGPVFKMQHDPRITRVGRFLRTFSIDELPQLWNVLVGDMSLVGPRPPVPSEVIQYETRERRRLSMRPGITCLWQVSGRNSIGFEDWVKLDLEYIDTWSIGNDIRILARTIPTVINGTGS